MKNVTGLNEFQINLKGSQAQLGGLVPKGLAAMGLFLQGKSQLLVPVDFGILKASAFTRSAGKGAATIVSVGYTASYAMFVHEMPSGQDPARFGRERKVNDPTRGSFWDPAGRGQSKFLEAPSRDAGNRSKMMAIMRNVCKLNDKTGGQK
jgi:hypothetical protein